MLGFMGWKAKALHLRETLLVGHRLAKVLRPEDYQRIDLMRDARRARIAEDEPAMVAIMAKMQALGDASVMQYMMYEPASIHGWDVRASLYLRDERVFWLVSAQRAKRTLSASDRKWLAQILEILGGHIDHDAVSTLPLEDLVEDGTGFVWTWINQFPLTEMHVRKTGKKVESRIVTAGTPPSDGFMPVDFDDPPT